ncbi:unnamed protein product, partial [Iphiclides podalirius]
MCLRSTVPGRRSSPGEGRRGRPTRPEPPLSQATGNTHRLLDPRTAYLLIANYSRPEHMNGRACDKTRKWETESVAGVLERAALREVLNNSSAYLTASQTPGIHDKIKLNMTK